MADRESATAVALPSGLEYLLLPGFDGTGRLFSPLLSCVASREDVRVAQYPAELTSLAELGGAAQAQVRNWPSTVVLCESMGGLAALELCRSMQSTPAALVFCAAFGSAPQGAMLRAALLLPDAMLRWAATNRIGIRVACVGSNADAALSEQVREISSGLSAKTLRSRLQLIAAADLRDMLPTLQSPVLYLQAGSDRLVPRASSNEFCELVPNIRRVVIPGPHLLLQTAPRACLQAIVAFLRDVRARAASTMAC
jgi:pimeloyl-ACP methyl ester carboxylesterase